MRVIKSQHKNLFILEAIYILSLRDSNINYDSDDTIIELFCKDNYDIDSMTEDIRCFRRIPNYKLKSITEEEYEKCVDKFGCDLRWMTEQL